MTVELGLRVVRGPDWKWGNQDSGEGHVGTVVEIGKPGSSTSPDRTVVVQWDSGSRTNYRVGYQGAYDLRVLDNAPVGIKHPNIICDSCCKQGICGTRWKCARCYDFDLCTTCYMADKHDLTHPFIRFDTAASTGVEMLKRQGAVKIAARGIFVGAKVVRGPDWDWGLQDGGEGKTGKVIDIRGWETESGRSVASVTWSSGSTNVYRLGHKGKVDLKYIQDAPGGYFYRDHLPVLGVGVTVDTEACSSRQTRHSQFSVGDRVKMLLDIESLKIMQDGHGGWNPRMTEVVGKIGVVHRVTDRGDIRVQYEGCNNRWTVHPDALTKVVMFSMGDMVRISDDLPRLKELQVGHGEYIDAMKTCLGKLGKVTKVYTDGDLRVNVEGQTWTFNPLCVVQVPGSATELSNTMTANTREEHANPLLSHLLAEQQTDTTALDRLVREAAQGHLEFVREHLAMFPERVNQKSSGKTALQVASHQGHTEIVDLLINCAAVVEAQDDDGDTALHYAAFGNQPVIMERLLKSGAHINAVNKAKCTALHVAVNKQHVNCVRVLLKFRSQLNINIQDSYGDTALHDAIAKENLEIIDLLINVPEVDFSLKNKRGFNVLHHAALKGNNFAVERLLSRTRQIVDIKKDDGFAALHLAALNGHFLVVETLLIQGQCEPDVRNNRQQTPLLLAVSQGHCSIAELLVGSGSQVNTEDEDGDTALHVALLKRSSVRTADLDPAEAPIISGIVSQLAASGNPEIDATNALACFLAKEGADLCKSNLAGRTPLDLAGSPPIVDLLHQWSMQKEQQPPAIANELAGVPVELPQGLECHICMETLATVLFEPCGHTVTCEDCCVRMKKCISCQEIILNKIDRSGRVLSSRVRQASLERLRYLESKIQEIEESQGCSICMERRRNVAFLCGHGACSVCSQTLRICHMCRKAITKKIYLY
uniref:RING-type E3 ubiquitin transferase n=1 Tax=Ornithodoros turicata TaxID=34597 RepID=A0A2R5LAE8_9ACAR